MKVQVTFFDLETTSPNPVFAEVLTGFFKTLLINFEDGSYDVTDELFVNCQPLKYLHESFGIHGISESESRSFGDKRVGLRKICEYLSKNKQTFFCCHANAAIFGRHGHFDWTVIKNDLTNVSQEAYDWFNRHFRDTRVISTHTIAKKLLGRTEDGLKLKHLVKHYNLGIYKEHDAVADVEALIKVFFNLISGMNFQSEEDLYDLGHYSGTKHWTRNGLLI